MGRIATVVDEPSSTAAPPSQPEQTPQVFLVDSTVRGYLLAVLTVGAAISLRWLFDPLAGLKSPFMLFSLAVIVTARFGGRGPGFAATAAGLFAARFFFLDPRHSLTIPNGDVAVRMILFAAVGTMVTLLLGQQRRALKLVSESEQRLRQMADVMPSIVWTAGASGTMDYVNSRGIEYIGLGSPVPDRQKEAIHPDDRPRAEELWRAAVSTGQPYEIEYRVRRFDGVYRWHLTRAVPERDHTGTVVRWLGTTTDIHALRQAQSRLKESEARSRQIIEASPFPIIVHTESGSILTVNQAWIQLSGYSREEIPTIGDWIMRALAHDAANARERIRKLFNLEHMTCGGDITITAADGSERIWEVYAGPFGRTPDGQRMVISTAMDVTERRRAERAVLEQSEQELRILETMVAEAPVGLVMFDRTMRTIQASQRWIDDVGLAREAVIGRNHYEVLPNLPERWKEAHRRGLAGESLSGRGDRTISRTGEERWVNWEIRPWGDEGIETGGIILYAEDITEHVRAQAALVESEERFRAMADGMPQLAWMAHPDGHIFWINQRVTEYTGLTLHELEGWNWTRLMPADATPAVRHHWQNSIATGESMDIEFPMLGADGRYRLFLTRARARKDSEGRVLRWFGTATDLSEQRQAEAERNRQAALLDMAFEPILAWELGGPISYWNRGAEALYGYTRAEALGRVSHELLRSSHPLGMADVEQALVRDGKWRGELRHTTKDGREIIVESLLTTIVEPDGRRTVFEANRDITDRKRAEAEIQRFNAELESRVRERTAQIETANRELEAFSYSVSHDLRAPLRGIEGWSTALVEDCAAQLDEQGRSHLNRVLGETRKMALLIDALLQLSRLTRTQMTFHDVDLSAIALETADTLSAAHPGRAIEFHIEAGLKAQGDEQLLRVVLANLLENAVKFTSPRAVARIEFGRTIGSDGPAFRVRDNGVGFEMAYARTLFGAFQRLHKESEFSGTGIGLATVQRIIHRHGGRVWAEARVNEGAEFYFTLGGAA